MFMVQPVVQIFNESVKEPSEIIAELNKKICEDDFMFVTM